MFYKKDLIKYCLKEDYNEELNMDNIFPVVCNHYKSNLTELLITLKIKFNIHITIDTCTIEYSVNGNSNSEFVDINSMLNSLFISIFELFK